MKVESIGECSPWSILQYFWPVLSDGGIGNQFFLSFLSGHFRQVLLYFNISELDKYHTLTQMR